MTSPASLVARARQTDLLTEFLMNLTDPSSMPQFTPPLWFELAPMMWSAFGTAIAAPFVFAALRRVDASFQHGEEAPGGLR